MTGVQTCALPISAVTAIALPTWAQPPVKYEGCVVTASPNQAGAAAFLKSLTTKAVQARFTAAGFLLPKAIVKKTKKK